MQQFFYISFHCEKRKLRCGCYDHRGNVDPTLPKIISRDFEDPSYPHDSSVYHSLSHAHQEVNPIAQPIAIEIFYHLVSPPFVLLNHPTFVKFNWIILIIYTIDMNICCFLVIVVLWLSIISVSLIEALQKCSFTLQLLIFKEWVTMALRKVIIWAQPFVKVLSLTILPLSLDKEFIPLINLSNDKAKFNMMINWWRISKVSLFLQSISNIYHGTWFVNPALQVVNTEQKWHHSTHLSEES